MRRLLIVLLLGLVGCSTGHVVRSIDEDFYGDLAFENTRVAATLALESPNGNLDSLTLGGYLSFLDRNESPSAAGLARTVRFADETLFQAKGDSLLVVLFFKEAGQIVGDNSSTSRIDTVVFQSKAGHVQTVGEIAKLMRF
jgi:hypothetical protein